MSNKIFNVLADIFNDGNGQTKKKEKKSRVVEHLAVMQVPTRHSVECLTKKSPITVTFRRPLTNGNKRWLVRRASSIAPRISKVRFGLLGDLGAESAV